MPNGYLSRDLPLSGPLSFVGVPTLSNSLLGTSYIVTARAVTGCELTSQSLVAAVEGLRTGPRCVGKPTRGHVANCASCYP